MAYASSAEQGQDSSLQQPHRRGFLAQMTGSFSGIQTTSGGTAIVLAILGLAGFQPMYMATAATIAVALALAFQGHAVGECYSKIVQETGLKFPVADLQTGLTAEFVAGAIGVLLGILSLLNIEPATLTAVAAVILGCGVLLGAGIANRLAHFANQSASNHPFFEHLVADAVTAAAGAEVLVGGGAIVLGVITLVHPVSYTLPLAAMLALGSSMVMTSTAVAGRIAGIWTHP
ncbi:MAG: hypothetical protein JW888_03245 [Pirellulales bacterium]|nr:hypothetical protein [Pirellulales bacterium]